MSDGIAALRSQWRGRRPSPGRPRSTRSPAGDSAGGNDCSGLSGYNILYYGTRWAG